MKSKGDSDSTATPNEIRVVSRKELAKEQRQEAYQRAKLRRATTSPITRTPTPHPRKDPP
jgi:hypothetical protein